MIKVKKNDASDLKKALEHYRRREKPKLLQVGKRRPFKPFDPVEMTGNGPTAAEMVIQDRV